MKQQFLPMPVPHAEWNPQQYSQPARWAVPPPHKLGEEVALLHPNGSAEVRQVSGYDLHENTVGVKYGVGTNTYFKFTTGKCVQRKVQLVLSKVDMDWFKKLAQQHNGETR